MSTFEKYTNNQTHTDAIITVFYLKPIITIFPQRCKLAGGIIMTKEETINELFEDDATIETGPRPSEEDPNITSCSLVPTVTTCAMNLCHYSTIIVM